MYSMTARNSFVTIQEEEGIDLLFFVYRTSFLMSFFYFLFIPHVGYKTPSLGKTLGLLKVCFEKRISLECIFIMNPYIIILY